VAIVSANAFDRALDNGLGIAAEDFIVKPLRHSELLDWLERRLQLHWLQPLVSAALPAPGDAAPPTPAPGPKTGPAYPPRDELLSLQVLVQLGYYRGIVNKLEALAQTYPNAATFVATLNTLARQYQFETMLTHLQKALDEAHH
jgi:hypothetical protein